MLCEAIKSGHVEPGLKEYKVVESLAHRTLKKGDLVRVVETPDCENLLLRNDFTLHSLTDPDGYYVILSPMESSEVLFVTSGNGPEKRLSRPTGSKEPLRDDEGNIVHLEVAQ